VESNWFQEQSTTAKPLDKTSMESADDKVDDAIGVSKTPGKRCPIFCWRILPLNDSLNWSGVIQYYLAF
jgi:hypothetical protein